MFLCSLFEELCTKDKNDKTGCNFNFGHECIIISSYHVAINLSKKENMVYLGKNMKMNLNTYNTLL